MDCIVLVKQVPDVSNIPEEAWDREKGTLRRGLLDSVLNPLDLHALTFADRLTRGDPKARTVFLSMGPPQAREVLVDCLSRVAGEAILLTDSAFAGADTGATAYSLACAIRRIEKELFGGGRDYVIVTGMQSVDGDTAQVPPQIAEELGIDHIAYAKGLETEPEIRVRRIGAEGIEDVRPLRWPVLITVTACTDPLYRSFERTRDARGAVIHEWNAASVGADPTRIGLKGSWTQVYRLFSPSEDRPKTCEYIKNPSELIGKIAARYQQAAPGAEVGDRGRLRPGRQGTVLPRRDVGLRRARGRWRSPRLPRAPRQDPPAREQPGRARGRRPPLRRRRRPAGPADRRGRRHRLRHRAPAPGHLRPDRPQEGDRRARARA